MQEILLVIQLLIGLALVGLILIQRSEGGALGMGGGGMMSARGTANFLTRTTSILAAVFIGLTLVLAVLASQGSDSTSVFDDEAGQQQENLIPPALEPMDETPAMPDQGEGEGEEPTDLPEEPPQDLPEGN